MQTTCPECGAALGEAGSCQEIFDRFLALEFSDPGYGAVHFLTVACFMIQHGRYSDEALVWIQSLLRQYFEQELSADQLRRLAAKDTSSAMRTWKANRPADAAPLPRVAWSLTIGDVAARYQDAASYRERVRQWARRTLEQMPALIDRE